MNLPDQEFPSISEDPEKVHHHEYLRLMEAQFVAFNQSLLAAQQPMGKYEVDFNTLYFDREAEIMNLLPSNGLHVVEEVRNPPTPSYSDLIKRNIGIQVPDESMEQDVFISNDKNEDECSHTTCISLPTSSTSVFSPTSERSLSDFSDEATKQVKEEEWIEVKPKKKRRTNGSASSHQGMQQKSEENEKTFVDWRGREIGRREVNHPRIAC